MKTHKNTCLIISTLLGLGLGLLPLSTLVAGPGHDHSHTNAAPHSHSNSRQHNHAAKIPGPNGGRILHTIEPHLEFFVQEHRIVQITFLDADLSPVKATTQVVRAITGDRRNPVQLSFTNKDGVLFADQPLPEGNNLPIILALKESPESEVKRERFMISLSECPSCDYLEYACICAH